MSRPGEPGGEPQGPSTPTSLVVYAGAAHTLLQAGELLAWTVLCGRFLGQLGASAMPSIYVGSNLATIALFLAVAVKGERGAGRGSLRPMVVAAALVCLGVGLRPAEDAKGIVYSSFLLIWIYETAFMPEYWGWLGGLLPLRETKRLSARLGAAGLAGRLTGAVLASDPLGFCSFSGQMLLAGILTGLALPCMAAAERRLGGASPAAVADEAPGAGGGGAGARGIPAPSLGSLIREVLASPLLFRLLVSSLLLGFFTGICDYPFSSTSALAYPRAEDLSAFFGRFTLALYLTAIVIQLAGVEPMLQRLPLAVSLGILPGILALGGACGMLAPGFRVASVLIFVQVVATRALNTPVAMLLLNAVPARLADPARALTYGAGSALGFLVAGLGLQLCNGGAPPLPLVFGVMAVAGVLGVVSVRGLDEAYLGGLRRVLADGQALADPEAGEALATALRGAPPAVALEALEALAAEGRATPLAAELAARLVAEPDPVVAAAAARAGARLGLPSLAGLLLPRLAGADPAAGPGLAFAEALLRCGRGRAELGPAVGRVFRERHHPDPARRAASLEVLAGLGAPRLRQSLRDGLDDPEAGVATAAARGLARSPEPAGLAALDQALARAGDPGLRTALESAARDARDRTLESFGRTLAGLDRQARLRTVQALGRSGQGGALAVLGGVLALEDEALRDALVGLLADPGEPDRVELVRASLAPGSQGHPRAEPLLDGFWTLGREPGSRLGRVLASLVGPGQADAVAVFVTARLTAPGTPPAPAGELVRLAWLAGLGAGRADTLAEAARSMLEDPDPRRASAAEELIESSLADPGLRSRVIRELRRARPGQAAPAAPAGPAAG